MFESDNPRNCRGIYLTNYVEAHVEAWVKSYTGTYDGFESPCVVIPYFTIFNLETLTEGRRGGVHSREGRVEISDDGRYTTEFYDLCSALIAEYPGHSHLSFFSDFNPDANPAKGRLIERLVTRGWRRRPGRDWTAKSSSVTMTALGDLNLNEQVYCRISEMEQQP